jgi:hypothetical protein
MAKYVRIPNPHTGYRHDRCYANGDNNCSTKISSEHFISEEYLRQIEHNGTTKIADLTWQRPQTFSILPIKGLASNVLCDRHNSALSTLDAELGSFAETIRDFDQGKASISVTRTVSGYMVELWMLKYLLGASVSKNIYGTLKPECVNLLFERVMWPTDWGLYYCSDTQGGSVVYHTNSLAVETFTAPDGTILVARFLIQGLPFFLVLGKPDNPRVFGIWHPREIIFKFPTAEKKISLTWDARAGTESITLTRAGTYDGPPPIWTDWEKNG